MGKLLQIWFITTFYSLLKLIFTIFAVAMENVFLATNNKNWILRSYENSISRKHWCKLLPPKSPRVFVYVGDYISSARSCLMFGFIYNSSEWLTCTKRSHLSNLYSSVRTGLIWEEVLNLAQFFVDVWCVDAGAEVVLSIVHVLVPFEEHSAWKLGQKRF